MQLGLGLGLNKAQILQQEGSAGAGEAITMTDGTPLTQTDTTGMQTTG